MALFWKLVLASLIGHLVAAIVWNFVSGSGATQKNDYHPEFANSGGA